MSELEWYAMNWAASIGFVILAVVVLAVVATVAYALWRFLKLVGLAAWCALPAVVAALMMPRRRDRRRLRERAKVKARARFTWPDGPIPGTYATPDPHRVERADCTAPMQRWTWPGEKSVNIVGRSPIPRQEHPVGRRYPASTSQSAYQVATERAEQARDYLPSAAAHRDQDW